MKKIKKIDGFSERYLEAFKDETVVFGDGNLDSDILFIGEAPGKEELAKKKPFVGKAGKNLESFLEKIELDRNSVYITNAIKHGLRKYSEKTKKYSNRPAKKSEIEKNRIYLLEEIDIIEPILIVTLGNVPLRAITGDDKKTIGVCHGRLIDEKGYRIFPLYHPASIIYNRSLEGVFLEDLESLKKIIVKLGIRA